MSDWTGTNTEISETLTKLSDDFSEFMIIPINITPITGRNKFGEPTYGYSNTVMGIVIKQTIQFKNERIDKNNLITSDSQVYIDGNVDVNETDRISFGDVITSIKKIEELPDENGTYAKIIYC